MSDEKMREAFESTFIEKPTVARHGLYELSWVRCEWSEFKRGWKAAIESMKEENLKADDDTFRENYRANPNE